MIHIYRPKQFTFEAIQFTKDTLEEAKTFTNMEIKKGGQTFGGIPFYFFNASAQLYEGDYIVKTKNGFEVYKKNYFENTFEVVE